MIRNPENSISTIRSLLKQPYDCLILVDPHIQTLNEISSDLQSLGIAHLNISQELSSALMTVSASERGRFAQERLKDRIRGLPEEPVLCSHPDLLCHPSLNLDFYGLIRQIARSKRMIVLWPGEYAADTLTYAVPAHHHYRVWKISDSLRIHPKVFIYQISAAQGV